jgi:hypothetical protein
LGNAIPVAQMHEEHSAQIAPAMHPPHQQRGFPHVGGAQLPAAMRPAQLAQEI